MVQGDQWLLDVAVYVDQFSTLPTHLHGVGCGLMLLASKKSVVGVGHVKRDRFPILPVVPVAGVTVDVQDAFAQKGYLKAQLHMKTGDLRMGVLVSHMITNLSTYTSYGDQCFDAIQSRIKSYRSKSQYPKAPFFMMADLNVTGESYGSSTANYGSYVSQYLLNDGASTLLTDTWRAYNSDLPPLPDSLSTRRSTTSRNPRMRTMTETPPPKSESTTSSTPAEPSKTAPLSLLFPAPY